MHNLGTVFRFEVLRTIKKKSFWITAFAFPVIIALIFFIVFVSNQTSNNAALLAQQKPFSLGLTDPAHRIAPTLIAQLHGSLITTKEQGIKAVASGQLDAYFYYPAGLKTIPVEVYGKDVGIFNNARYQAVAQSLLQQSVAQTVDQNVVAILQGHTTFHSTTYKDGQVIDGYKQVIAPGIFLVLFYILIAMFGNQMLTSTTEEKENRVIEMLLTTVQARVLIIGKILSLIVLALIQIGTILLPIIILYTIAGDKLALPSFDLTHLPIDPVRMVIGATVFFLSFLLFTGLLVAIGAAMPTAKEANGFFGIVMLLIFGPLYAVSLFVSTPDAPIVRFLSLFPLTAPIPLMLRNAVGNLSLPDALLAIGLLALSAMIVLALAIRLFRYGALEYSKRVSLKAIFSNKKSAKRA